MNFKKLGLPLGFLKDSKLGTISLTKIFRSILSYFNVPYVDPCCESENPQLPMGYLKDDDKAQYYDAETKTWVDAASGGGGGASYLVYTALLSQSGIDDPVATVLENTFNYDVADVFRSDVGTYGITISLDSEGYFLPNKTFYYLQPYNQDSLSFFKIVRETQETIVIETYEGGSLADTVLNLTSIEIRVYP